MECENCRENDEMVLVRHHEGGKLVILCANCHLRRHRKFPIRQTVQRYRKVKIGMKEERVFLPPKIVRRLDRLKGKLGNSRSEIARNLIKNWFDGGQ